MNYLHDKKVKKNSYLKWGIGTIVFLILIFFRAGIFESLTYTLQSVFRTGMVGSNSASDGFGSIGDFFASKQTLSKENEELRAQISAQEARMIGYNVLRDENNKLKEDAGRKVEAHKTILSAILSKPNKSAYDTIIIDVGANQIIKVGDKVFAKGDVPVGRVAEVYPDSSKVVLYTSPGEKTEVVVAKPADADGKGGSDTQMTLEGRGGGNFEMVIPLDFDLPVDTLVHLPGLTPYVVAKVETILSDPRDSVKKALLSSPVNIQEQKFVEVEN